jgi:TonB family protein
MATSNAHCSRDRIEMRSYTVSSFGIAFVLTAALAATGLAAAEDKAASPNSSPFLKACSHKNPRPCIDKPPAVTHSTDPDYTREAQKQKFEGTVVLQAVIGVDGVAHDIKVLRSLGYGLDEQAVKALQKWTFKPASSDGKPVPSLIAIEVPFHLR